MARACAEVGKRHCDMLQAEFLARERHGLRKDVMAPDGDLKDGVLDKQVTEGGRRWVHVNGGTWLTKRHVRREVEMAAFVVCHGEIPCVYDHRERSVEFMAS
jgi:hypothetical protein